MCFVQRGSVGHRHRLRRLSPLLVKCYAPKPAAAADDMLMVRQGPLYHCHSMSDLSTCQGQVVTLSRSAGSYFKQSLNH